MTNITVEQVCAATGLGRKQVFRLTRKGCIPASLVGNPARFVMTEGQFDQLMRNGVKPEPKTTEPVDFLKTRKRAS